MDESQNLPLAGSSLREQKFLEELCRLSEDMAVSGQEISQIFLSSLIPFQLAVDIAESGGRPTATVFEELKSYELLKHIMADIRSLEPKEAFTPAKPRDIVEDKIMRWSGVGEIFRGTAESENETTDQRADVRKNQNLQPTSVPVDLSSKDVVEEPAVVATPPPISLTEALQRGPTAFTKSQKPSNQNLKYGNKEPRQPFDRKPSGTQDLQRQHNRQSSHAHLEPGQVIHL